MILWGYANSDVSAIASLLAFTISIYASESFMLVLPAVIVLLTLTSLLA